MRLKKLDKIVFISIIIIWILVTSLKIISYGQSYVFLGLISIFLCVINLINYMHIFLLTIGMINIVSWKNVMDQLVH